MLTTTLLSLISYAALLALSFAACSMPLLGILQQEGYSARSLLRFFYRKKAMLPRRYELLSLAVLLVSALFGLCFSFGGGDASALASVLGCALICGVFYFAFGRALKVPVSSTPRLMRLAVIYYFVLFGALFGSMYGLTLAAIAMGFALSRALALVPLCLFPLLFPLLLGLANTLALVYELPRRHVLISRAKKTLENSPCVKVGITGSFGKTSVKHIAAEILATKYRVLATPASYNTPIGIAKAVNENGAECDFFLAEMGARKTGDIRELIGLVRPTVGVVTGVCPQHVETFGSLENIKREKGLLAQAAEKAILGASAAGMKEDALVEGRDFSAEDITLSPEGTEFTLALGEEKCRVRTRLLGRHAAEDIAIASCLCRTLGMSMEEIAAAIPALTPVPHRLEKIAGAMNILDDSYNSNIEGAKCAVEVLGLFSGRRAVVTPGLVELGELEEEKNRELGALFVGLELVVLVGETRVRAVRDGYVAAGGKEEALVTVPTLGAAQEVLHERLSGEDAVLFLNDLPDKYL